MTCIVGYVDKTSKKVYIGGDSCTVNSHLEYRVVTNPKVFERDDIVFGFTSTWRFGQLVQYIMHYPAREIGQTPIEYLCRLWIPALQTCLTDHGHIATIVSAEDVNYGHSRSGNALIGIDGELFYLNGDFSVLQSADGMYAVGCGADYAMGALMILDNTKLDAKAKVISALETSERLSGGVRGPFLVLSA